MIILERGLKYDDYDLMMATIEKLIKTNFRALPQCFSHFHLLQFTTIRQSSQVKKEKTGKKLSPFTLSGLYPSLPCRLQTREKLRIDRLTEHFAGQRHNNPTFQIAEVLVSKKLFQEILERIQRLKPVPIGYG